MNIRNEKISNEIKRTLSAAVSNFGFENKLGMLSISFVKLTKDLSIATLYVNVFVLNSENKEEKVSKVIDVLNKNAGIFRSIVANTIRLRKAPALRFYYDDTMDEQEHIDALLVKMKTDAPYKEDYGDESVYKEE